MKLKTHSGMKKRVKARKNKITMQKACKRHLLANKSKRQKGLENKGQVLNTSNKNKVKKMLPYL